MDRPLGRKTKMTAAARGTEEIHASEAAVTKLSSGLHCNHAGRIGGRFAHNLVCKPIRARFAKTKRNEVSLVTAMALLPFLGCRPNPNKSGDFGPLSARACSSRSQRPGNKNGFAFLDLTRADGICIARPGNDRIERKAYAMTEDRTLAMADSVRLN